MSLIEHYSEGNFLTEAQTRRMRMIAGLFMPNARMVARPTAVRSANLQVRVHRKWSGQAWFRGRAQANSPCQGCGN